MKQLITILAASLLFFSCNKKEKYEKKILGIWVGTSEGLGGINGTRDTMFFKQDSILIWSVYGNLTNYKYYYDCNKFNLLNFNRVTFTIENKEILSVYVVSPAVDYYMKLKKIN